VRSVLSGPMPSVPNNDRVKGHYRDRAVADRYDDDRFGGVRRRMRNARELRAVGRAIAQARELGTPIGDVLDLPCGTGRLLSLLHRDGIRFVGADTSLAMMAHARTKAAAGGKPGVADLVQCEADRLPFKDRSFDCVVSLRFMLHLDGPARRQSLAEMARVSRRWLVIDVRHKYTTRYLTRLLRKKLTMLRTVGYRFSRTALERELRDAGLRFVEVFPSRRFLRWFSDKWFLLAEVSVLLGSGENLGG
jgi:ubiquinone/menaquinone biosynthesis C-methylase UbiE